MTRYAKYKGLGGRASPAEKARRASKWTSLTGTAVVLRVRSRGKTKVRKFASLAAARDFARELLRPVQLVTPLGYAESADGIVVIPISGCRVDDLFGGRGCKTK